MSLLSLPLICALAKAEGVVVPVDSVIFPDRDTPERPPTSFMVSSSVLEVEPGVEHVELELVVRIEPLEAGWVDLRLLDGSVRLYEDSEALVHMGSDGHWWFTEELDRPRTITLRGSVPRRGDSVSLRTTPAVRQRALGLGEDLDFEVFGAVGDALPPSELVEVSWKTHVEKPVAISRVVQGRVSTAAWIDEGDLRVRSAIRWTVRRGETDRFEVQLSGALAELEVTGAGLERFDRSGDRLIIYPTESVDGVFEVLIDWRVPFKDKKAELSQPRLPGTATSTATLTLAGDGEVLLSPEVDGLRGAALAELPGHARSVGDANPTAAWTGSGTLSLKALQLSSLEGPELVVDRAVCTEASSAGGRSLLRCQLDVRNASRQFLRVSPPGGSELWAARVNGEGVAPVVVEDGTMAVPLERSVETLSGLTTLDVEMTFVGAAEPWRERWRGKRSMELPGFDAPVAQLEWEFRLPPGYEASIEGGSARSVGEAASGTEIVYAVTTAEEKQKEQAARETWNAALHAYQDNDFEVAQSYIDETLALDAGNDNALRLQGNLDVLSGDDVATRGDEAMSRRVKDMAKAKVAGAEVEQEEKLDEAERALAAGDYDRAMEVYDEVEVLSRELSRYEQTEQNEQAWYGTRSSSGKAEAKKRLAEREASLSYGSRGESEPDTRTSEIEIPPGTYEVTLEPSGDYQLGHASQGVLGETAAPVAGLVGSGNAGMAGETLYDVDGLEDGYYDVPEVDEYVEFEYDASDFGGRANYSYAPGVTVIVEEPAEAFDDREFDFATGGTSIVDLVPERARRIRLESSPDPAEMAVITATPPPSPAAGPVTSSRTTTLQMPTLSATTLAIPLPDHGASLSVVQRLLAPGEVPTLEITYREER